MFSLSLSSLKLRGFTIIEIVIALVIISILTSVALPSFQSYLRKARRTDGKVALMDLAAKMEHYYVGNNSYIGASLANIGAGTTSPEGYYNLVIDSVSAVRFTVSAIPAGVQAADNICGTLTINQLNEKAVSGAGSVHECW